MRTVHGVQLYSRPLGIRWPHGAATPLEEAGCPSCEYHCPIDERQSLIQHFAEVHGVDLGPQPENGRPARTIGVSRVNLAARARSESSTQARQRLPSPANSTSSGDESNEDVEGVIDGIITGFNKFLRIVGRG